MSCNVLEEYINFSKTCLKKYVKKIMVKKYDQDIFDKFISIYVDSRYYNVAPNVKKSFEYNVAFNLREQVSAIKESGLDSNITEQTFKVFKYLLYFDNVKECDSIKSVIKELDEFRINELELPVDKDFQKEIYDMVKADLLYKKQFIEKLKTKNFDISFHLTNISGVYNAILQSNLKFPSLYDQKAIKKVFDSKEIFEERLIVEYSYVATQVLMDVIKGDFRKKYLVNYTVELNDKKNNLKKLLNTIDNDVAKEKVIIKLNYSDFMADKESIYIRMRLGFKYAVVIDEGFVYTENNLKFLTIFKYIIISSQSLYYKEFSQRDNVICLR